MSFSTASRFFAAFAVYRAAQKPGARLQQSFRERVLPVIFGFIEEVGYEHNQTPISFERLPHGIVGRFNKQRFDDVISGPVRGFSVRTLRSDAFA